jgi:hypothetical protein
VKVKDGLSVAGFGFLLMTRQGKKWNVDLFDSNAKYLRECIFADGRIDCPDDKKAR